MLTDKTIKAAIAAVQTELTLNDGATNGRGSGSLVLVVRRLANGQTSAQWFASWKRDGKRQKKQLGRYPETSLAVARQMMATDLAPQIRAGKTPRQTSAELPTVARMFQGYADSMKDKGRASATEVERALLKAEHNAADALGRDKLAANIEPDDVVRFVSGFFERGHRGAADKARSYIASAFTWAIRSANDYTNKNRQDWGVTRNPAADLPKDAGAIGTRDRNLSAAEIRALWFADGFTLETRACVRLLIACGQRVQETLRIEGSEIDLLAMVWRMPAHKTKGGTRAHTIPLPLQAMQPLADLIAVHGSGPLFPARTGSKSALIPHQSINQAIGRWIATSKAVPFQTRDIRRTWKSRTHDAGIDRFTRDLIQQHAKHDTGSKNYDRADYMPQMRKAMDQWQAWLEVVLAGAHPLPVRAAA
jgi:integrase